MPDKRRTNTKPPVRWSPDRLREPFATRQTPLLPPNVGIFDAPAVCAPINRQWLSHALGALDVLTEPDAWNTSDGVAQNEIEKYLRALARGEGCKVDFRQRGCILQYSKDGGQTWLQAFDYSRCLRPPLDPDQPRATDATEDPATIQEILNYYDQRSFVTVREWLDESKSSDPSAIQICKAAAMLVNSMVATRLVNSTTEETPPTEAENWLIWTTSALISAGAGVLAAVFFPVTIAAGTMAIIGALAVGTAGFLSENGVEQSLTKFFTSPGYTITDTDMEEAACCIYDTMRQTGAAAVALGSVDWSCVTSEPARAFFAATIGSELYPVFLAYMDDSDNIPLVCPCVTCFTRLAGDVGAPGAFSDEIILGLRGGTQVFGRPTQISTGNWRHGINTRYVPDMPLPPTYQLELTVNSSGGSLGKTGTALSVTPAVSVVPFVQTGESILRDSAGTRSAVLGGDGNPFGPVPFSDSNRRYTFNPWSYGGSTSIVGFEIILYNFVHTATGTLPAAFQDSGVAFKSFRFCPAP